MTTKTKKSTKSPVKKLTVIKSVPVINKVAKLTNPRFLETYIPKTVHGKPEFAWFDYALANKQNVLSEGPTGCGKTTGVLAWSVARNLPTYTVQFSASTTNSQLFGQLLPPKEGETEWGWQDGAVTDIMRHGGCLILDDATYARETQMSSLIPTLDKRRRLELIDFNSEIIEGHPNLLIVATANPFYAGTRELNPAMRNRFGVKLTYDYDREIESQLVKSESLLNMADQLREGISRGDIKTPISTNMLVEFESITKFLGFESACSSFLNAFDPRRERSSVKVIVDTWKDNIIPELDNETATIDDNGDVLETIEVDDDFDVSQLGIQGTDWDYETKEN